jgi:CubicO group peptidase (beta-lactamase class C family)
VLFGWLPCARAAAQGAGDGRLAARIDSAVHAEVTRGFSGVVVVSRGRDVLLDKAYGSVRGVAVAPDTRFWIASTGKQFVSAAILRCRERGLLTLDDSLSRFLPDAPADKRGITLRQLLAHQSGLDQSYVSEGVADRATAVWRMLADTLVDRPGRAFRYSNSNFQLAAAIVEVVTGQSYKEYVRRELWPRAGLVATGFAGDTGSRRVAPATSDTPTRLRHSSWGGEGVYSTAGDLWRWYDALRSGRVLSRESTAVLFAPVAEIEEGHSALGWFVGHTSRGSMRIFTRGSESFGAHSLVYAYPETETVVIIVTHAGNAEPQISWSRFVHAKIEALLGL